MKKLILSVSLVLISLNGYPQSLNMGNTSNTFDTSNNPSGVGFSGAMGGANPNTSTIPSSTTTPNSSVTPDTGTSTVPSATLPQQQEERGNFAGGSMGGQTTDDRRFLPSDSTVPPTQPKSENIPAATGVGTGAPTSY